MHTRLAGSIPHQLVNFRALQQSCHVRAALRIQLPQEGAVKALQDTAIGAQAWQAVQLMQRLEAGPALQHLRGLWALPWWHGFAAACLGCAVKQAGTLRCLCGRARNPCSTGQGVPRDC